MRSIKELLGLMLQHQELFRTGLCTWIFDMYFPNQPNSPILTTEERKLLSRYVDKNRPSKYSGMLAFLWRNRVHYWPKGWIRPRIKWITTRTLLT